MGRHTNALAALLVAAVVFSQAMSTPVSSSSSSSSSSASDASSPSPSCPPNLVAECKCSSTYAVSITCRFPPGHNLTSLFNSNASNASNSSNASTAVEPLSVQLLDLSDSHLTSLPEDLLSPFAAVHSVHLGSNQLTTAPLAALQHGNVSVVKVDHNLLTEFNFTGLTPSLTSLDLSYNLLENLHPGLGLHAKFQHLNLSRNLLQAVPAEVYGAAIYLDLSHNRLASLPQIADSETLYLDVSSNLLTALPEHVFHGLHVLDELDVADNQVAALEEGSLMGLANLTFLNLARNRLATLPPLVFQHTPALLRLELAGNGLQRLEATAFPKHSFLQSLSLAQNRIASLQPDSFLHLQDLRSLDLSSNPDLSDVASTQFPLHLTFLDLSNCSLPTVDECQFLKFLDIQHLDLSGNPLQCSCHLAWMTKWLKGRWTRTLSKLRPVDPIPWTCLDSTGATRVLDGDSEQEEEVCSDHSAAGHHCNDPNSQLPLLVDSTDVNLTLAVEGSSIMVSWELKTTGSAFGFRLKFELEGEGGPFHSPLLEPTERSFTMKDMALSTNFTVCLDILANATTVAKTVCTSHTPTSFKLIIGIMAGFVFLVPCIIILAYIIHKDRQLLRAEYLALEENSCPEEDKDLPPGVNPSLEPRGKEPCPPGEGPGQVAVHVTYPVDVRVSYHAEKSRDALEDQAHVNQAFQAEEAEEDVQQEEEEEEEEEQEEEEQQAGAEGLDRRDLEVRGVLDKGTPASAEQDSTDL